VVGGRHLLAASASVRDTSTCAVKPRRVEAVSVCREPELFVPGLSRGRQTAADVNRFTKSWRELQDIGETHREYEPR